jgi:poly-gamma-glutamate synthesis protein (capsule biosynthesis protein)
MGKISFHWYAYWLGCVLGGLVLGFILVSFRRPQAALDLAHSPPPQPEIGSSPLSLVEVDNFVSILFTGDVMLGRSVNHNILKSQDPTWPFHSVQAVMSEADITYINLENPLLANCPITDSGMKFCGGIENVKGLLAAGVDVASLANNHSTNYGQGGLEETIVTLEGAGIVTTGTTQPAVIMRKGTRYAFVSFNDIGRYHGISSTDSTNLKSQLQAAEELGDVVIATFHWGNEYESTPTARQISLAHAAVDYGADLVIGAHPHWVQSSEIYKGKTIYYSLGNFVFDQEWSAGTKRGLVVRANFQGSNLLGFDELPVLIEHYGQPHWQ